MSTDLSKPAETFPLTGETPLLNEGLWFHMMCPKILTFLIRPLLAKWLKCFKTPTVLVISESKILYPYWKKRFKAKVIHWMTFEQATASAVGVDPKTWDAVLLFRRDITPAEIAEINPVLKKGGAFVLVTRNLFKTWPQWQEALEAEEMSQLFPLGFHPKGALWGWPLGPPPLVWLGRLLYDLLAFFPGRYAMSLWWQPAWIIRGIKRDEITRF